MPQLRQLLSCVSHSGDKPSRSRTLLQYSDTIRGDISTKIYCVGSSVLGLCYGAPSRGMASHALLRHNNAAGKSHIQYDPPLSRLPAKQKSNATLFAGLNHVNENAIGAGLLVGLASWLACKEKDARVGARICFVTGPRRLAHAGDFSPDDFQDHATGGRPQGGQRSPGGAVTAAALASELASRSPSRGCRPPRRTPAR